MQVKNSELHLVTVGNADQLLLPPSPKRRALLISPLATNRLTITFKGLTAVLDQGLTIYPAGFPLQITIEDFGEALMSEIRAISVGGGGVVGILESFSDA